MPAPAAFAPVVALRHGGIVAYRGYAAGVGVGLDGAAVTQLVSAFAAAKVTGKVLLNIDPRLARRSRPGRERIDQLVRDLDVLPNQLILEVTRPRGAVETRTLYRSLHEVRALGFDVSIDDLRGGEASLAAWSDLQPDMVRIGGAVLGGLHQDAARFQYVRLVRHIAQGLGSQILASDVASEEDLRLLRDLGIDLAEGPLICAPALLPSAKVASGLAQRMGWSDRASLAPVELPRTRRVLLGAVARPTTAAQPQTQLGVLEKRFETQAGLEAIAVVHEGAVHGCISRAALFERRKRRDWERWRERRADEFMEPAGLSLDAQLTLQDACMLLAQADEFQFSGPIVVTERGRYLGLVQARQLMQELTHLDVNRNVNPLTGIPGDFPIHEAIQGLLDQRSAFVACSADIAHLKSYNQVFGYARGDNLIKYTAILLQAYCDERLDFFGQESGGQFVLLMRRPDWQERLDAVVAQFATGRQAFLEKEDIEKGGYLCHDRRGNAIFNPLPEMAIGAVQIEPGNFTSYHQVVEAVRVATAEAKKDTGSAVFVERRRPSHFAPA